MAASSLRALVGARVSVLKGAEKVSNLAQIGTGSSWVVSRGHRIVGTFEDLDVSADKYTPFDRPDLGRWLTDERAHEWDMLVFSKVDRAFRSIRDTVDLARWIEARKKILVFAEDGMVLNYRDDVDSFERMMSEFFIMVASFFAQMELNRFKSRAKDAHRIIRQTDRWANGVPPYGFWTAPHPSGKGRCLVPDPEGRRVLREVIAPRLLAGDSFSSIVAHLNATGVLTNMNRAKVEAGREPKADPWTVTNLRDMLTSLRTQGIKMSQGKPVLTEDGSMIRLADPTFDDETWTRIQEAVAARSHSGKRRVNSPNPLLSVGFCGKCGSNLSHQVQQNVPGGKEFRYYRCQKCKLRTRADEAEFLLEELFIETYGQQAVTRRIFVPGSDNSRELEEVEAAIKRLRMESDAGLITTEEDQNLYVTRLSSLVGRRNALQANPVVAPTWRKEKTGETNAEVWARSSQEERRKLLQERGIRFVLHPGKRWELVDIMGEKST